MGKEHLETWQAFHHFFRKVRHTSLGAKCGTSLRYKAEVLPFASEFIVDNIAEFFNSKKYNLK